MPPGLRMRLASAKVAKTSSLLARCSRKLDMNTTSAKFESREPSVVHGSFRISIPGIANFLTSGFRSIAIFRAARM